MTMRVQIKKVLLALAGRRSSHAPELAFVDVDQLFENSLEFSGKVRPWAIDANGIFSALEFRYRFSRDYLSNPAAFNPAASDYVRFVRECEARDCNPPYDGNRSYAIVDSDSVANRYVAMIDFLQKHMDRYNRLTEGNLHAELEPLAEEASLIERTYPRTVYFFKTRTRGVQPESERAHAHPIGGIVPSAVRINGRVIIKNGSHRLAAFKAFKDLGVFTNRFPVYIVNS